MRRPRGVAPSALDVFAAAKVNLGWRVGPRRGDGYHEVSGLIQTISVHDTLQITTGAEPRGDVVADVRGVGVGLTVEGEPGLATPDNLVLRAARRLAEDVEPLPTSVVLRKSIPVAAGLGGGSADAAAALTGLGLAWAADLSARELLARAAEVGSDVPAIIIGGLVHVSGRGEKVRNVGCVTAGAFVIGVPEGGLGAAEVYERFDVTGAAESADLVANDLERAACDLHRGLRDGLQAMRDAGAPVVFVAGSGPAVVGLVPDRAAAPDVAERVRAAFAKVLVADPSPWGVRLRLGGRRKERNAR